MPDGQRRLRAPAVPRRWRTDGSPAWGDLGLTNADAPPVAWIGLGRRQAPVVDGAGLCGPSLPRRVVGTERARSTGLGRHGSLFASGLEKWDLLLVEKGNI
jgi:hypothetical protein